ncbi:MAG: hypothetical protein AAF713_01775 [Pseudomonadota bacterium]
MKLNELYKDSDKKKFFDIIKPEAKRYSRHVSGRAVDIKKNTDKKILFAIGTVLRRVNEKLCTHFDDQRRTIPAAIDESVKSKWR